MSVITAIIFFVSSLGLYATDHTPTFDPYVLKKGYDAVLNGRHLDYTNKTRIGCLPGISFLSCVEECLSRRRCKSINYFNRSVFCHWNYDTGQESELLTWREDALYVNVTKELWDEVSKIVRNTYASKVTTHSMLCKGILWRPFLFTDYRRQIYISSRTFHLSGVFFENGWRWANDTDKLWVQYSWLLFLFSWLNVEKLSSFYNAFECPLHALYYI